MKVGPFCRKKFAGSTAIEISWVPVRRSQPTPDERGRSRLRRTLAATLLTSGGPLASAALRDLLHLTEMVQIVAGEHADNVGDRLLAALLMHAVVLPQILGQSLQHGQVVLPQDA